MISSLKGGAAKLILWLGGWKVDYSFKKRKDNKFIVIAAPHTSNWDYVYSLPAMYLMGIRNLRFLIKKQAFFFPLKYLLRWGGGIPVDRSKKNDLTVRLRKMLASAHEIYLLFPPEGTRSRVERWKTGFYYTAVETKLPVILGYIDYKERKLGFSDVFYLTGNFEEDMEVIQSFYAKKTAKYPDKYNKKIYIPKT